MRRRIAALTALAASAGLGLAGPAWTAPSELHEDGTGYVAGADVRAALGWNWWELSFRAASVGFVAETGSATRIVWQCADPGTSEVVERQMRLVVNESRAIAAAPQTFWWVLVVGFRLEGFDGRGASSAAPEGPAPNSCPAGPWVLVEGSTQTVEEPGEPVLAVVHEGVEHVLPVLPVR